MADEDPTYDDLRAELDRLDAELVEIDRDVRQVRDSLADGGPMDAEDRASALSQIEELEQVRDRLSRRRETVRAELGSAG